MAAAAVIIIINRRAQAREALGELAEGDCTELHVLADPNESDAEILQKALAQVERDQA